MTRPRPPDLHALLAAALLAAGLTPPLQARPPLAVPEWARVEVRPRGAVEAGREVRLRVRVVALVGPVTASPPTLDAGPGLRARGAARPGRPQTARPGHPVDFELRVQVAEGADHPTGTLRVSATLPREDLTRAARERYRDAGPAALEALQVAIEGMPGRPSLMAPWVPPVTPEDGALLGSPPLFTRWVDLGGARLALWDPPHEPGTGAAARKLATASPRLAALLRKAGVKEGPPSPASRYRRLAAPLLEGGRVTAEVATGLEALAASPDADATARGAAMHAAALARWRLGDALAAQVGLEALGSSPVAAYAHLARGELLRLQGKRAEAADAYRDALRSRAVLTRARQRLAELQ